MQELDNCLSLAKKIRKKEEDIEELKSRVMSPKGQIISDMPKGGGFGGNALESYYLKLERFNKIKLILQLSLNKHWKIVISEFHRCGITDPQVIELMSLRYYKGREWKECCKIMRKKYPENKWNKNKSMRIHRYVLCKLHK